MPRPADVLSVREDVARPGWQQRLVDDVFAAAGNRRNVTSLQLVMPIELRALIRAAADTRGMATSSYARRAIAAFVAADLGVDFTAVCELAPPARPDRSHGRRGKAPGTHGLDRDDGAGYGHWHACSGGCGR